MDKYILLFSIQIDKDLLECFEDHKYSNSMLLRINDQLEMVECN